jgi:energy-coupling factor transporter ATP-binding protein EcfA2
MFLNRFGVKNYKCLGDIDIPLTPIHVLIGPNDSGKTSLLEAMAAFHGSAEYALPEVFPKPWSGRELVRHGSDTDKVDFCGEWTCKKNTTPPDIASLRYGLSVKFPHDGQICFADSESFRLDAEDRRSPRSGHQDSLLRSWRKKSAQLPGELSLKHLDAAAEIVKPAHKYSLDATLMAVPATIDPARKFRLDPDGFGLATLLDDILGYNPERFIGLRTDFCGFFPQFQSVRIETENALQRQYAPDGRHQSGGAIGKGICFETRLGARIRARQASDGAILFLAFLALAYVPTPPTLLLIEEPENGIYPKKLGEVIKLLKDLAHRSDGVQLPQIIISTHSPYVVSFFEPEEVTFLGRPAHDADAPVRARPLRDAPHIHDRLAGGEFYLGELWYNLTEEELFGDS